MVGFLVIFLGGRGEEQGNMALILAFFIITRR